MEIEITFEGHIPSKKNSVVMMRHGGKRPSKAYERWHSKELASLINAPAIPSPVAISYAFYIGGKDSPREFDLSNSEESINDLLVDAGIIQDDSWFHLVERRGHVAGFVRGQGRCVVKVRHVPEIEWREPVMVLKSAETLNKLKQVTGKSKTELRRIEWEKLTA